jgi:hypothetical protein
MQFNRLLASSLVLGTEAASDRAEETRSEGAATALHDGDDGHDGGDLHDHDGHGDERATISGAP